MAPYSPEIRRTEEGLMEITGRSIHNNDRNNESVSKVDSPGTINGFIHRYWLLMVNCTCLAIGGISGPLLIRLYYVHGGRRKWIPNWMQTVGFPIMLIPLTILYRRGDLKGRSFLAEPRILVSSAVVGILLGIVNFMYSSGMCYLPVSTSSLLSSMQLAFTAIFALIIVKHKFTPYTVNAVVLMTLGSVLLGVSKTGDRPANVSHAQYTMGFILILAAAALLGFISPCVEFTYSKAKKAITYPVVMQFQLGVTFFATIFSTIGMIANKDFMAITRDANSYELGATKYYIAMVVTAIVWQLTLIGSLGVIFCSSSLFSGIFSATILPLTEIAALIVFKEKFDAEKGMSLVMCLWAFTSYFYGSYREIKKRGIL